MGIFSDFIKSQVRLTQTGRAVYSYNVDSYNDWLLWAVLSNGPKDVEFSNWSLYSFQSRFG